MATMLRTDFPIFAVPATHDAAPRLEIVFDPKGSVAGFIERTQTTPKDNSNDSN
jgi:hypothetical protein